ncbi:hypothetical protein K458DRAFT_385481 [Lentithecium fluviatile CBS 122367]|uniref:Uncharacterized protein n=1 Tax=Lentithecium fluviatile CBS 122367 TaxID=1168545 RepID=A0A6G1JCM6_9PLEO|nr:hypothetical protein K458DRAFT_385481 [Lentithecium fluviatile CBS 122367]
MASAIRRKSIAASSPLASVSEEAAASEPPKDKDVVSLKEIIRKGTKRVIGSSPRLTEAKEEHRSEPMLIASPSETALGSFDFEITEQEKENAELTPPRKVRSRDSGYHSTPEV